MNPLESAVLGLYFLTLVILAALGSHRYIMVYLYYRHRSRRAVPIPLPERLPRVTVQLPIFNEMYVVDRLLDSVARIRYANHFGRPGCRARQDHSLRRRRYAPGGPPHRVWFP